MDETAQQKETVGEGVHAVKGDLRKKSATMLAERKGSSLDMRQKRRSTFHISEQGLPLAIPRTPGTPGTEAKSIKQRTPSREMRRRGVSSPSTPTTPGPLEGDGTFPVRRNRQTFRVYFSLPASSSEFRKSQVRVLDRLLSLCAF